MKTNVQETSMEAYHGEVKPTLTQRQVLVLNALRGKPEGMTNCEIAQKTGMPINSITPRVFELRQGNLVSRIGQRPCLITGRTAIVWAAV